MCIYKIFTYFIFNGKNMQIIIIYNSKPVALIK